MSIKQQLESDIDEFFRNSDKQLPEGRKKSLILLFDKYMHITSDPVKFIKRDFEMIKSHAIDMFKDSHFPKDFNNSYSKISTDEAANFCLVVATISYLQSKDCLKKLPIFDLKKNDTK